MSDELLQKLREMHRVQTDFVEDTQKTLRDMQRQVDHIDISTKERVITTGTGFGGSANKLLFLMKEDDSFARLLRDKGGQRQQLAAFVS